MNPLRRFAVFLLPLLLACTAPVMAQGESSAAAAKALHLLSYLAADYPATVSAGDIRDASEYREQQEFARLLPALVQSLPASTAQASLLAGLAQLGQAIEQRQDGASVSLQARSLAQQLAKAYAVSQSPAITPDAQRGAQLFAQQCSVCHGVGGQGDGPASIGMQPAPTNLTNAARLDQLSLYDLFNTLTLGVDGTDMAAFADQLDERQRWDLAVYVASLSVPAGSPAPAATFSLQQLSGLTPAAIAASEGAEQAAAFRAARAQPQLPQRSSTQLIEFTRETLQASLKAYREGASEQAYDLSVAAYLEGFELVEGALNNVDPAQRKRTEQALMAYRQALQEPLPASEAEMRLQAAGEQLQRCVEVLGSDGLSQSLSFFSSLLILLREGLEAILVLAAILAFLNKTGQQHATRSVHVGWGLALVAGFTTWAVAALLLDISGAQRELLEGGTALFASVMLLWLGVWMHGRRQADAWQAYLRQSMLGSGGRFGFALLAFIAVYRELFEVILFYETLWLQAGAAGQPWVIAGALVALVLLLGLAWGVLRGAARLPLGAFFSANALLMCALAVVFAGHGVAALKEAGRLPLAPVPFLELDWLGVHPDAYGLAAQGLVLALIALFYGRDWWRSRQLRLAVEG